MVDWEAALKAIGGLTAIGGLIDLALYKVEKEKLRSWLEDWWLRFTDVKWSNFGRKETELAVQILDRWAGARLWSWRRWKFSILVTLLIAMLVALWDFIRVVADEPSFALYHNSPLMVVTIGGILILLFVIPAAVALVLSLSLTRFIAVRAGRWCTGRLTNPVVFGLLLVLHWLLLCYWSSVVLILEDTTVYLATRLYLVLANKDPVLSPMTEFPTEMKKELIRTLPDLSGGWFPSPNWSALLSWDPGEPEYLWYGSFKIAMDIVANGIRILFALVFLSSFVFRPLIQEPASRLWYAAMNSGKPFFTTLFGIVGTLVAVARPL